MNIYDFDKTIYNGDSTFHFIKYCALRYPKAAVTAPKTLGAFIRYRAGKCTKTQFKEVMYRFLRYIPEIDSAVSDFWDRHEKNIFEYYKNQQRDDDIVISASPEFLLEPICERLGIKYLIASRVDKKTGVYTGENCWGAEKVKRLEEKYNIRECESFYSDSLSDQPLADTAKKSAFIVTKNGLIEWNKYKDNL